ncbi:WD40/YVTN repeat-like-containing domain,Enhancer of mRNA-decapping protein 4, WD40 repeat region,WD40- [Cinara cedri]|uniref:WD40/YVTN repeat-like-containing domain,Enhancer of mRNA-decapping protein 4, WD40 repeat region,WD40 n=1 Tax=Cinara cedri TaxID=506608 RepID=A0A5E4NRA3_9HEMI|nr:WD40/YVTN repeat-like-containing domain,Enhancer of mRNA-decapping protein 4, WD40 repeat region,WD40- [Cinara cedri]
MADEYTEAVRFIGNDEESTHLIHDSCTTIFSSTGSHNKGSSKLTLKNFVNYSWGQYYYRGQLIALHIGEKYLAYAFTKPDTSEGLVRIVKIDHDNYSRALIKGFSTAVEDISFAHIYEIIMLACIDQSGNIYIYVVKEDVEMHTIKAFPVFQINGDPQFCYSNKHLISWCQYIPEQVNILKLLEFEPIYKGKILAIVRGSNVEVWHIGIASSQTAGPVYGNFDLNTTLDKNVLNTIKSSVIKFSLSDSDVVSVSFSPDGSSIAIAFSNGSIFFYQISFETSREFPKCVFNWHPDDVFLSLRSMLFLDNRKHVVGDIELWKYVVTFSSHNELILWSCETWKQIQKLKFVRPYNTNNPMKLSVDGTGRYLFLSDIDNNLLYVMETSVDINSSQNIKIVSISEILLHSPMLNMIILNAKIDHNEVNFTDPSGIFNGVKRCSTIINLFAIQPKSLQEGQLIISSPEISIKEQIMESNKIEPTTIFPKAPTLDTLMDSINISQGNSEVIKTYEEKGNLIELTSMEVHCLVKEKLRLKGININSNSSASMQQIKSLQNMQSHNFNAIQPISVVQSPNSVYSKNVYELELNEIRECSPINNEVQQILTQNPEEDLHYEHIETHSAENRSFEESNFIDGEKEEALCFSGGSVFNRTSSSLSAIQQPTDKSEINNGIVNQIDDIYTCLQDINSQLKWLTKKQKKIDTQISTSLLTNKTADLLSRNLEPALTNVIKNASEQAHKKLQMIMEHQLTASQKKMTDIARNSNSNQINTELVTRSLVASLSPTLDAILKDLFMSTVIPKFEQACVSMFSQIDTHITHLTHLTERSLEYQNELKLVLNEEGNINNKLEYAFDKFTDDMTGIIKLSEKKILNAQTEMQEHFAGLIKEKTLSHVESYVKDSEPVVNQYLMLSEILDRGDVIGAFEKALCASNLDLVIFVCEKIHPEDFFHQSSMLGIPIVLSLVQQLSHDLVKNTELKHAYLEAAVSYLDYSNDSHRETINKVLIKMNNSIDKFIKYYPAHPYGRKLKMLRLAVKTIIHFKNHVNS